MLWPILLYAKVDQAAVSPDAVRNAVRELRDAVNPPQKNE
jgi:hypothetical protein